MKIHVSYTYYLKTQKPFLNDISKNQTQSLKYL